MAAIFAVFWLCIFCDVDTTTVNAYITQDLESYSSRELSALECLGCRNSGVLAIIAVGDVLRHERYEVAAADAFAIMPPVYDGRRRYFTCTVCM